MRKGTIKRTAAELKHDRLSIVIDSSDLPELFSAITDAQAKADESNEAVYVVRNGVHFGVSLYPPASAAARMLGAHYLVCIGPKSRRLVGASKALTVIGEFVKTEQKRIRKHESRNRTAQRP